MSSSPTGGRARASRAVAQLGLCAALALFALCAAVVIRGSLDRAPRDPAQAPAFVGNALPGAVAEPFRLPDLDSRLVSLQDLRGRVVLLCVTNPDGCADAVLPRFSQASDAFRNEPRVQPVAVLRTDSPPGSPEINRLRMDLAATGFRWPALLDVTSGFSRDYRAGHGTTLFVIDARGVIRLRADDVETHPNAFADAARVVDRLLNGRMSTLAVGAPRR